MDSRPTANLDCFLGLVHICVQCPLLIQYIQLCLKDLVYLGQTCLLDEF